MYCFTFNVVSQKGVRNKKNLGRSASHLGVKNGCKSSIKEPNPLVSLTVMLSS